MSKAGRGPTRPTIWVRNEFAAPPLPACSLESGQGPTRPTIQVRNKFPAASVARVFPRNGQLEFNDQLNQVSTGAPWAPSPSGLLALVYDQNGL